MARRNAYLSSKARAYTRWVEALDHACAFPDGSAGRAEYLQIAAQWERAYLAAPTSREAIEVLSVVKSGRTLPKINPPAPLSTPEDTPTPTPASTSSASVSPSFSSGPPRGAAHHDIGPKPALAGPRWQRPEGSARTPPARTYERPGAPAGAPEEGEDEDVDAEDV